MGHFESTGIWNGQDRVGLSKGHAGVGHAPLLSLKGYIDREELKSFNHFKSPFGMHLDGNKVKGVDVSTGSLGHGLSMAVGLALGARQKKAAWRTICILGDGECNERSGWKNSPIGSTSSPWSRWIKQESPHRSG